MKFYILLILLYILTSQQLYAKNETTLVQKLALYGIECGQDGQSCWLNRPVDCIPKKNLKKSQLPLCGDSTMKLAPSSLPLAGVFIGCRAYREDCLNSVKAIARETPEVKINLIVDVARLTEDFVDRVIELGENVNIIPANRKNNISSSEAPTFARDQGVFAYQRGMSAFIHMPYINSQLDSSNTTLFKYISSVCQFSPSQHSYISKTDFQSLVHAAEKTPDAYGTPSELSAEFDAIWREKKKNMDSETYSMGGNFLPLPFDILAVGRSVSVGASANILSYFKQFQNVIELSLPEHFGHIDEIFNVVPNYAPSVSECSFAILQASPMLLLRLLGKTSVPLQDLFMAQENDIEMMNRKLISFIKKANGNLSTCVPKVIKLPASAGELLRSNKNLISFNPINGLSAGTVYFYSQPRVSLEVGSVTFQELENKVAEQLKSIGIKTIPTDTRSYDNFGGNLHCATNEVRWPCQPEK